MDDPILAHALRSPKRKKHGGRRKGTLNRKTLLKIAEKKMRLAEMSIGKHEKPLDFLLEVMGAVDLPLKTRLDAAKSAAPYVHYRLVSNDNLNAVAVDPERSSAEIRDDIRRLLTDMGVDSAVIEAIVGPRCEVHRLERHTQDRVSDLAWRDRHR